MLGVRRPVWFILVALVVAVAPQGAQAQAGDLQVTSVSASESPLVLDGANVLVAVVRNVGSGPATFDGAFTVSDGVGGQFTIPVERGSPLLGGQERRFEAPPWNGRTSTGTALQAGSVSATFTVEDTVSGDTGTLTRNLTLEWHTLQLAVADRSSATMPPGRPWGHLTATVTNAGSRQLPAQLELAAPAGGLAGWTYSFRADATKTTLEFVGQDALAPGTSQQAFIYITAPYTAEPGSPADQGPGLLRAKVGPTSPVTTVDLRSISPHVVEGGEVAFEVLSAPPAPVAPGAPATFNVHIRNDQNRDEIGTLSVSPPATAAGQSAVVDPLGDQGFSAAEGRDYSVSVAVPSDLSMTGARAGPYDWTVSFLSAVGQGETTTFTDPLHFEVVAVRRVEVTVLSAQPDPAEPGDALEAVIRVCNRGNIAARYVLASSVMVGGVAQAWSANAPAMPTAIEPGACATTGNAGFPAWSATVPDGAAAGPVNLRFVATDLADASVKSDAAFRAVQVAPLALPALAITQDTQPVAAGQAKSFPVRVVNRGNVEGTFTLNAATLEATPTTGWSVSTPSASSQTLAPLQEATLVYTVTAPSGTQAPGDRLILRVTASAPSAPTAVLDVQAIAPFADLRVCPSPVPGAADLQSCAPVGVTTTPATLFRGYAGTVDLLVSNLGGKAASQPFRLDVQFLTEAGVPLGSKEVTVAPLDYQGATRSRTLQVAAPTASFNGPLRVRATIDALAEVPEGREDNNLLELPLQVEVFGVQVARPPDLVVHPGEQLSFSGPLAFLVENLGTRGHDLVATPVLSPSWTTLQPVPIIGSGPQAGAGLAKGAAVPVTTQFRVPLEPLADLANLTLRVSHAQMPAIFVDSVVRLRIDDSEAPILGALKANRTSLPMGEAAALRARATDATGIREARLYIVDPAGAVRWEPMGRDAAVADQFVANATFTQVGTHRLHFWAKDGSTAANVADSAQAPLTIVVLPSTGPSVQLVAPAQSGAVVRPGVPIVYALGGTVPLHAVHYESAGRTFALPLAHTVQVATDGLPDGPFNVVVVAKDTLGQQASVAHTFTIDGTAPDVRSIRMSPEAPPAGSTVRFTANITDASPLRSVVLRLQGADGRLVDHAMMAANGTHEVLVQYPAGVQAAQVVAEDAAGNRGFAERALDAAPRKDAPAPVALLQAILLLALAATGRRRTP